MTHSLEYWVDPETRTEGIGGMTEDLLRSHGHPLTRLTAEQMASARINFLEQVAGRLIELEQAEVAQRQ